MSIGKSAIFADEYDAHHQATSLVIISRYVFPMGKAHSYLVDIVEERPVVHIGIRGRIVTIQRTRASFGTIVRIAESSKGTKTGDKEFYLLSYESGGKDTNFCCNSNVKERIFNIKLQLKYYITIEIFATRPCPDGQGGRFRARCTLLRLGCVSQHRMPEYPSLLLLRRGTPRSSQRHTWAHRYQSAHQSQLRHHSPHGREQQGHEDRM